MTLRHLSHSQRLPPPLTIEAVEVRDKVGFEEHPPLSWLGRLDDAGARLLAQHGRRHPEEIGGLREVQRSVIEHCVEYVSHSSEISKNQSSRPDMALD